MKALIAEDDFVSRRLMQRYLEKCSECDIASNGREALEAFRLALKEKTPYDLICLDIMMPELDGKEVLKAIREIEKERGVIFPDGVKIIMTTANSDRESVILFGILQCNSYLVKPVSKERLFKEIETLGLLKAV
ncbi:MAG: response regulator [Nitrospirae bacterium]|nr:response regulator [Nitrospirota bacterium]